MLSQGMAIKFPIYYLITLYKKVLFLLVVSHSSVGITSIYLKMPHSYKPREGKRKHGVVPEDVMNAALQEIAKGKLQHKDSEKKYGIMINIGTLQNQLAGKHQEQTGSPNSSD